MDLDPEDLEYFAEQIREDRNLPYTLTIEKVEDGVIWTHNQWGNSLKYSQDEKGHYKLVEEKE